MKCPCCSNLEFKECCEPILKGIKLANTPLELMRSRYTAYNQANIQYIEQTMLGPALTGFNKLAAKKWAKSVHWISLAIKRHWVDIIDINKGYVEFEAIYQDKKGVLHQLCEKSEFRRLNNQWFYWDGEEAKQ